MRKILILACAISIFYNYSDSQLIRNLGIKAGVMSANQSWNYPSQYNLNFNFKDRSSFNIGFFAEWLNNDHISIISELFYVQKGFVDKETFGVIDHVTFPSPVQPIIRDTVITWEPKIDYLSIPLMIKYRTDIGNISPYVIMGPRIDILLHANSGGYYDVINNLTSVDYGINIGGGIESSILFGRIVGLEFQYNLSLRNVYEQNNLIIIINRSMQFLLFITF
jgi:Outer membrane protein beta-barrel domain